MTGSSLVEQLGRIPLPRPVPGPARRVHVPHDLSTVERVRPDTEVPGPDVGLEDDVVEHVWDAVRRLYRTGIHPAIAVCLRRDGQVVLDRSIGHARGNGPGHHDPQAEVVTPGDPFIFASASKSITAMVVHLLDQRGLLHVDDRVCEYVPEFAANGKESITLNHVLSHRSGVPNLPPEAVHLDNLDDDELAVELLSSARPSLPPGRFVAYHAVSGGFILAEVVRRVTGRTIDRVLVDEILEPLGFEWMRYGTTPDRLHRVVENHATGMPVLPPLSLLFNRAFGMGVDEVTTALNDPRMYAGVVPAANVVGTADELCRFFELLRRQGTLDGVEIFEPRTIRRAISEQSYLEVDLTLGFPARYGMGFILGARWLSLYGPETHYAFGHLGFTNIVGWADPERRLSAAILTSGKPILGPHLLAFYEVVRRIASRFPRDGIREEGRCWA